MNRKYTDEKNVLILLSLLKQYGIDTVIASPGTTNATFVRSVQVDPYFTVYSSVDERSAAYMACGLAAESGKAVVISCTGATASRNYLPGLTEAYHRKLPVLAITSTRDKSRYGHLEDQVIDRTQMPIDAVKYRVHIPNIKDEADEWECKTLICDAILELSRGGGGPVHVNLSTTYDRSYATNELPSVNAIWRRKPGDELPQIPNGKTAIFVGSHHLMSVSETEINDSFCDAHDAVVLFDHTSGYRGRYGVRFLLPLMQIEVSYVDLMPDLIIHIGEISGFYHPFTEGSSEVWRVSPDGQLRDLFKRLTNIFEMQESHFFESYSSGSSKSAGGHSFSVWQRTIEDLERRIPDVPFSNLWVAKTLSPKIPTGANIHFGILNSLSSWNYFALDHSITTNCNVGGYGIDGCVSSLIGASLLDQEKLYFGFVGDLAFFYDMNSIGNRHVGNNVRILMVNNGKGVEFKIKNNPATQFGAEIDEFIAAAGPFGKKSRTLVRDNVTNLGFDYLSADSKEEFFHLMERFCAPKLLEKPIFFEVFTDDEQEDEAQKALKTIEKSLSGSAKRSIRNAIGDGSVNRLNKLFGRT